MSDRERQRKFEAQARIKSSEFDRHNTNQTRQSSPTGLKNLRYISTIQR